MMTRNARAKGKAPMAQENEQLLERMSVQEKETAEIKAMLRDISERMAIPRLTAEEQTEVLRARAATDRRAAVHKPLAVEDDGGGEASMRANSEDPQTPGTDLVPEAHRETESSGETPKPNGDAEMRNPRHRRDPVTRAPARAAGGGDPTDPSSA